MAVQRTIVVGLDGSADARRALRWAAADARRDGAKLVLVHAWHVPALALTSPYAGAVLAEAEPFEQAGEQTLAASLADVDTTGLEVETQVRRGPAASVLVEAAEGADLLVVGSRGLGGFSGMLLGSVGQRVASDSPVPVVIVPRGMHIDERSEER